VNPVVALQQKITPSKLEKEQTPEVSDAGDGTAVSKSVSRFIHS
jgi:hypothetical protein